MYFSPQSIDDDHRAALFDPTTTMASIFRQQPIHLPYTHSSRNDTRLREHLSGQSHKHLFLLHIIPRIMHACKEPGRFHVPALLMIHQLNIAITRVLQESRF